jgi:hypothetical protein
MAEGYKNWASGDTLTAADLEDYTVLQSVMRFADSATRGAAIAANEGRMSWLHDVNSIGVGVTGSTWSTVGPLHGALTSWTATVTQGGALTVSNVYTRYLRIGRMIQGWFSVSVGSGTGTPANAVIIGGLPATAATSGIVVGSCQLFDASAPAAYVAAVYLASTTTFDLRTSVSSADNRLGVASFTAGLANTPDTIHGSFQYEAAADA